MTLDEVAIERTERVDNPTTSQFDRFVGSDDMDRFDWGVRRWRPANEVTSAAKVFHSGDYLFVRRSLYASEFRERAARAGFSGLCSGDILPLREKPGDAVAPGFLGAVLNHPSIWAYVVKHATGSITRRIKWRDLARYEFALPPLEDQQRAVRAIDAASSVCNEFDAALTAYRRLAGAHSHSLLSDFSAKGTRSTTLGKVCKRVGVGIASSASHAYRPTGIPFLRNTNVKAGRIDTSDILFVDPAFAELHRSKRVFKGDIVMTRTATDVPGDAAVVPPELDGAQAFTILVCTPDEGVIDSSYLCHWINGTPGRAFIRTRRGGAKQQNLGATFLAEMPIRLPSLADQRSIVAQLQEFDAAGRRIEERLEHARRLIAAIHKDALG
jgi:type I restriction enzyme S subunit